MRRSVTKRLPMLAILLAGGICAQMGVAQESQADRHFVSKSTRVDGFQAGPEVPTKINRHFGVIIAGAKVSDIAAAPIIKANGFHGKSVSKRYFKHYKYNKYKPHYAYKHKGFVVPKRHVKKHHVPHKKFKGHHVRRTPKFYRRH